jgi:hypothetical protein
MSDEQDRANRHCYTDEELTRPFNTERGAMGDYFWPTLEDYAEGRLHRPPGDGIFRS